MNKLQFTDAVSRHNSNSLLVFIRFIISLILELLFSLFVLLYYYCTVSCFISHVKTLSHVK